VPLQLDVTDPASVLAAATGATDVQLLINNAGLAAFAGGAFDDPQWLSAGVASLSGFPLRAAYSASKAATHSLTQATRWRRKQAPRSVTGQRTHHTRVTSAASFFGAMSR